MPLFLAGRIGCLLILGGFCSFVATNVQAEDAAKPRPLPVGIPGEFERQAGLVLSWKSEEVPVIGTLLEIGQIASKRAPLVVLVSSPNEREDAEIAFEAAKIDMRKVEFIEAPVDTIWARDFGPVVVRNADGSAHFVDSDYDDGDRPQDDNIPPVLAAAMGAKCKRSLLTIEGGNLLSNGAGLCLTTSKTVADNVLRGYEHPQIAPLVRSMFQCRDVAILEPLVGEPTGHVDMFAMFTSEDCVVVATIDPVRDPVNAAVLDRNAKKLAGYPTPSGPLHVERIPMPVQDEGLWRSFTNALLFNGVVMMPTYQGVDPRMQRDAAEVYRRLLPGWQVRGIDCTKLIRLGGAVHCVTLNLPELKPAGRQDQRQPEQVDQRQPAEPPFVYTEEFDLEFAPFARERFEGRGRDDVSHSEYERRPIFAHPDRSSFPADEP